MLKIIFFDWHDSVEIKVIINEHNNFSIIPIIHFNPHYIAIVSRNNLLSNTKHPNFNRRGN